MFKDLNIENDDEIFINLNLNQHLYEKSYNDILERERILNPESNLILEKNSVYYF